MAVVSAPRLTREDYRLLPDSGPRYQLVEGELYIYHLQADAQRPAATCAEGDTFSSPHFPGLAIAGVEIFKPSPRGS